MTQLKGWSQSGPCQTLQTGPTLATNFLLEGPYTLQFDVTNIEKIDPLLSNLEVNPLAEVIWTVHGNPIRRLISIGSGTTISGVGQGVKVRVYDLTQIYTPGIHSRMKYNVIIALAYGLRANIQQPPVLLPNINDGAGSIYTGRVIIDAASNVVVPIPKNAGVKSVFITANRTLFTGAALSQNDVTVEIDSATSGASLMLYPAMNGMIWVPVPAGAETIKLYNNLVAGPGQTVLFNVTFGIDG